MTSYPTWELWMTLFVISYSHKPPPLHVNYCFSVSHWVASPWCLDQHLYSPLLSNPHIMAQCVTTWHIIYWYTPAVKGSRCWLLRMTPIVPCGITQWYVSMAVAEMLFLCSTHLGNIPPSKQYIYSPSYTPDMGIVNYFPCRFSLNSMCAYWK